MGKQHNRYVGLVAGAVMQLFLGIIYIWSVFVAPVAEHFQWSVEGAKLTSSFMLSFFVLGILFGGKLQVRIGTQKTVLIGGMLLSAGMALSGILPTTLGMLLYLTYGIIGGFGVGMGYNAIISTAQKNFPDKRGLATGIAVCTFGFSTVVFTPLAGELMTLVGLQPTFLILAAVFLVATLACFSFITMAPQPTAAGVAAGEHDLKPSEIIKKKEFYFITLSLMFGISVFFILNPSFFTLAQERGMSTEVATAMVMATGIFNALGRLFFPLISDKVGRGVSALLTLGITALSAFGLIFAQSWLLFVLVVLCAFCYGGISGVYPLVTGKHFGLRYVGSNYGLVMLGFALSALLFPLVLGMVPDLMAKFAILGTVAVIGSALLLPIIRKERV